MRYGAALPPTFEIPSSFRWVLNKDLGDKNPFALVRIRPRDRVMDIGAAVGTFSAAALEAGAGRVLSYEPNPQNAEVLRRNMKPYGERSTVIEAALVPDHSSTVTLMQSGFPGTDSVIPRKKTTKSYLAHARCFQDDLRQFWPDVIKLDIEGGEYGLLATLQPGDLRKVHCIFVEFHPFENQDELIQGFWQYFQSEGLRVMNARKRAFTALRQGG